ncbi:hypothetical protein EBT16_02425 [bacterium]|nr:hypothetical protein [bacterium]
MKTLLHVILLASSLGYAGFLEDFKNERRFGAGVSAGGPLSSLGMEIEFNLEPEISIAGGLGTGGSYSTLAVKGRYFLLGDQVSPYFLMGIARWWSDGTSERDIGPSVLKNIFLEGADPRSGFSVWTLYPGIGVQFIHDSGFSLYLEAHYFFKIPNFANGTYAGMGASWFF